MKIKIDWTLSFVFMFLVLGVSTLNAQNCDSKLQVEKNRNTKSADEDGANFSMHLINDSSRATTYTISTETLLEPCNKRSQESSLGLVELDISIQDKNSSQLSSNLITLLPGEDFNFKINVMAPAGTRINSWSCIKVSASSKACTAETTLKVLVPDSSEE